MDSESSDAKGPALMGCCGSDANEKSAGCPRESIERSRKMSVENNTLVDHKVTLLIAAGAAMAANCEPCLNKVVPDLFEAGVAMSDIRSAVEIGQYVKDRPAAVMKQAADVLAGTHLAEGLEAAGCPAEAMKQAAA